MTHIDLFTNPPAEGRPAGEALCLACAEAGTSCCRTDPDSTYLSFPLSAPEWQRLQPYVLLASSAVPAQGDIFDAEERAAEKAARGLAIERTGRQVRPDTGVTLISSAFPGRGDGAQGPWQGDAICAAEPNHPDFITSMRVLFPGQTERVAELFPPEGLHYSLRTRRDGACVFLGKRGCRLPRAVRPWYCLLFPAWMIENSLSFFTPEDCLISQKAQSPAHGAALLGQPPSGIRALHRALCRDWGLEARNNKAR